MKKSQLMLLSIYKDHLYAVVLQYLGHYCGYVCLKEEESKIFNNAEELIQCHGGITFVGHENGDWVLPEGNWIGFDCAHSGDGIDTYAVEKIFGKEVAEEAKYYHTTMENERTFTPKIVAKMCKDIVSQIEKINKED